MVLSRHGVGGTWREFHIGLGVRSWSSRKSTFPESSDLPEVPTCTGLRAAGSSSGGCRGRGGAVHVLCPLCALQAVTLDPTTA